MLFTLKINPSRWTSLIFFNSAARIRMSGIALIKSRNLPCCRFLSTSQCWHKNQNRLFWASILTDSWRPIISRINVTEGLQKSSIPWLRKFISFMIQNSSWIMSNEANWLWTATVFLMSFSSSSDGSNPLEFGYHKDHNLRMVPEMRRIDNSCSKRLKNGLMVDRQGVQEHCFSPERIIRKRKSQQASSSMIS